MTYGLTATGFKAKRAADVELSLQAKWTALLAAAGLPADVDFERDTVAGILTTALAIEVAKTWEAAQAIYDGTDPNNALEVSLDNIGAIRGRPRLTPTYSATTLTVTGVAGKTLPAGKMVEGGGADGLARWVVSESVTFTGGSDSVDARAVERGNVAAGVGEISSIVTPVDGWLTVTNAAACVAGRDRETDPDYRQRQRASLASTGGRSVGALRSTLLTLDGVDSVAILENRLSTVQTIEGKTVEPHSVLPVLHPSGLTPTQGDAVGLALWNWGSAGVRVGNGINDEDRLVEGSGFVGTRVGWDYAAALTVNVAATLSLASGYLIGEVGPEVEAVVESYFNTLNVGDPVRLLQILAVIADVEGVDGASVTLNAVTADVLPTLVQLATLGTNMAS